RDREARRLARGASASAAERLYFSHVALRLDLGVADVGGAVLQSRRLGGEPDRYRGPGIALVARSGRVAPRRLAQLHRRRIRPAAPWRRAALFRQDGLLAHFGAAAVPPRFPGGAVGLSLSRSRRGAG